MTATATTPQRDQASKLRAMVQTMYGPGVAMVTYADRTPPKAPAAPAPTPPSRRQPAVPVVAITSGKGGVGKTSLAVNLAIALSARRCRTSLLDADLGLANADVLCGMSPTTRLDATIDAGGRSLGQIAVPAPGGFRLVPGSVGIARMANLPLDQRERILDGLADLEAGSDLLLIDTGAGLSDGVTSFVRSADWAMVVATPEPTSIADAYAMIKCAILGLGTSAVPAEPNTHIPRIALVVNQARDEHEGMEVHSRIAATCKKFLGMALPLWGVVREDDALPASVRARRPVMLGTPRARVSRDIATVADRVLTATGARVAAAPAKPRRSVLGWFTSR